MNRLLAGGVLALALAAPAHAQFLAPQQLSAWEVGAAYGRDLRAEESLWAISIARTYGEGAKAVLEYADGRHGNAGARTWSLKGFGRIGQWGGIEFGVGTGVSYVDEAHESGWGVPFALEAVFRLTPTLLLRAEASRTFSVSGDVLLPANVVQAGLGWRF